MRMASIASGSSGNATFIEAENTSVLIDAGVSSRRLEKSIKELGSEAQRLDAVFITHELSDHIQGLKIFSKKYGIPVYASNGTIKALLETDIMKGMENLLLPLKAGNEIKIKDMTVSAFAIDHDANEPLAYRISSKDKKVAVATDMGHFDENIVENLKYLDAVLIEANHDVRMLETGPYPYKLKRRILSDKGHLSNENAGRLLCSIVHNRLKKVFLGHLSKHNNYPQLAYEAVKCEMELLKGGIYADDLSIEVASGDCLSCVAQI